MGMYRYRSKKSMALYSGKDIYIEYSRIKRLM